MSDFPVDIPADAGGDDGFDSEAAYEELLDVFRRFTPIPILLDPEGGYDFSVRQLRREILGRGLGALLLSNPCNPTGKVIGGEELRALASLSHWLIGLAAALALVSHAIRGRQRHARGLPRPTAPVRRAPRRIDPV